MDDGMTLMCPECGADQLLSIDECDADSPDYSLNPCDVCVLADDDE